MAKLLRTDLPDDVWDRLDAEAAGAGMKIGKYIRDLIIKRDARRHPIQPGASDSTSQTESESAP